MKSIDDELEQAVRNLETSDGAGPDAAHGAAEAGGVASPVESSPKRSWGLVIGLGALMAVVLTLFFSSSDEAVVYAYGVDEVVAKAGELENRQVRVTGDLVSGTLVRRDAPCEYRFDIKKADGVLPVRYAQCVVPDTFRDVQGVKVEVTVEGRLLSEGHLEASNIFAKCPSKYEMRESAAGGEMPQHGGGQPKPDFIEPRVIEGVR